MENELRLEVIKAEFDSDHDLIGGKLKELFVKEYNAKSCGSFNLVENSSYISIPFSQVVEGNILTIRSLNKIDVKFNGSQEIFNIEYILMIGSFTAIELRNNNDTPSDIEYEIHGKG